MYLQPYIVTIFGITSDLSRKKLLPALFSIWRKQDNRESAIIGFGRRDFTEDDFLSLINSSISEAYPTVSSEELSFFVNRCHYFKGNFDNKDSFIRLKHQLKALAQTFSQPPLHIFHLATAPNYFGPISQSLFEAGLHMSNDSLPSRLIVEKPFGRDLTSSKKLNEELLSYYREEQIYRIDHYLGKDAVQNILAFRFASGIFEPIWNSRYIDHIQITIAESEGIGSRAGYYDGVGALRDMIQNHCLQLLAHITMAQPDAWSAEEIRDKRANALATYRFQMMVTGQYDNYRREANVSPDSTTETFAAIKLLVHSSRWEDLPVYIRTGKCLAEKRSEISIHFKKPIQHLFPHTIENVLTFRLQPDASIVIQFAAKQPGELRDLSSQYLSYCYREASQNNAYEQLLRDCLEGDQTLFIRSDEIEASWQFMMPILDQLPSTQPEEYTPGVWEPSAANILIKQDNRQWYLLQDDSCRL